MPTSPHRPFRWDLVGPDQLGSLLARSDPPDLWFLDELTVCSAKILARGGGGQLHFVGRSADSVFDLLSGALAGTDSAELLHRLPFSFRGDADDLLPVETALARENLAASGLSPAELARTRGPVTFADLVFEGHTFTNLYRLLRAWAAEERAQWDVVRQKLRFVGVTVRKHTSPNTWRWHQHASWTAELPARSVLNVSVPWPIWDYLGNRQFKLTRSFYPALWTSPHGDGPQHDQRTRVALAEAVALVAHGRTSAARQRLARLMAAEPAFSEPWLRHLVTQLNRGA